MPVPEVMFRFNSFHFRLLLVGSAGCAHAPVLQASIRDSVEGGSDVNVLVALAPSRCVDKGVVPTDRAPAGDSSTGMFRPL